MLRHERTGGTLCYRACTVCLRAPLTTHCTTHSMLHLPQGVHSMFEGTPDRKWVDGEKRCSKMVFIGRDLDRAAFQDAFENCRARVKAGV